MLCIIEPNRRIHLLSSFRVFVHDGYCLNHGLSGSCTKEMHAVSKLLVWYKIPIWFQNTVCPKTKDPFPKIQASAYIQLVFTLASATKMSHGKMNSYFLQSLSWLFQLAYFVKCPFLLFSTISTSLLLTQPYPSSWGEWIVIACLRPPQNVKLGIFTGGRAVDSKEMYKKVWCTCQVVVLPCQA